MMVPFWREALDMVLDVEPGKSLPRISQVSDCWPYSVEEDTSKIPDVSIVEPSAELLYGLVHQRFILTKAGLATMVSLQLSSMPVAHVAASLACDIVFCDGVVSEGVLVLTQRDYRCRSTSRDISEHAQESSATRPMFCPADGQTRQGWTLSSSFALIAGIYTPLPAASSRTSMVSDGQGVGVASRCVYFDRVGV